MEPQTFDFKPDAPKLSKEMQATLAKTGSRPEADVGAREAGKRRRSTRSRFPPKR